MQLNQYLEENAIIQLDQKAGKDQGKFQVKSLIFISWVAPPTIVQDEKKVWTCPFVSKSFVTLSKII